MTLHSESAPYRVQIFHQVCLCSSRHELWRRSCCLAVCLLRPTRVSDLFHAQILCMLSNLLAVWHCDYGYEIAALPWPSCTIEHKTSFWLDSIDYLLSRQYGRIPIALDNLDSYLLSRSRSLTYITLKSYYLIIALVQMFLWKVKLIVKHNLILCLIFLNRNYLRHFNNIEHKTK